MDPRRSWWKFDSTLQNSPYGGDVNECIAYGEFDTLCMYTLKITFNSSYLTIACQKWSSVVSFSPNIPDTIQYISSIPVTILISDKDPIQYHIYICLPNSKSPTQLQCFAQFLLIITCIVSFSSTRAFVQHSQSILHVQDLLHLNDVQNFIKHHLKDLYTKWNQLGQTHWSCLNKYDSCYPLKK